MKANKPTPCSQYTFPSQHPPYFPLSLLQTMNATLLIQSQLFSMKISHRLPMLIVYPAINTHLPLTSCFSGSGPASTLRGFFPISWNKNTKTYKNMEGLKTKRKGNGITSKCATLIKKQRARLYIARRCATMLFCWYIHGEDWSISSASSSSSSSSHFPINSMWLIFSLVYDYVLLVLISIFLAQQFVNFNYCIIFYLLVLSSSSSWFLFICSFTSFFIQVARHFHLGFLSICIGGKFELLTKTRTGDLTDMKEPSNLHQIGYLKRSF